MKKELPVILFLFLYGMSLQAQTILGVDVSSYEGSINWAKVKAAGYTFAFAKATEGITITDSYFVGNQVNGTAAGMAMGAYHFGRPENNSATAEANYFLSVAGPYIKACHLPPVLDLEDPPSGPGLSTYFTSAQLTAWVQTWMTTVQNATGIAPIIYIGPSNASYVGSSLNVYGLWIDVYNSNPVNPPPNMGVWTNWEFKQYSWTGTVPGISGTANCDMDVFHGTMNQFNTLIGCNAVVADFTSNVKSICPGTAVNFTDKSTSTGTISGWNWTFTGGSPGNSTVQNPTVTYATSGVYPVKLVVTSTAGKDSVTYTSYIHVSAPGTLPLLEDFQSAVFPPAGWYLNMPYSTDSTWQLCTATGKNSSQSMFFSANCGQVVNISGERQQLYTPEYDFSAALKPELWFDVAYEPSKVPTYSDTLVIYYSIDCGSTWTQVYSKGGMTLCSTGSTTGAGTDTAGSHGHGCFVPPNAAAWRTDTIHLAAIIGQPKVIFSFESRSGWGNIIYLDNINLTGNAVTGIAELRSNAEVRLYPNPNQGSFTLAFAQPLTANARVQLYDMLGRQVYEAPVQEQLTPITLDAKPGAYIYRVVTATEGRLLSEGKLIVQP